MAASLLIGSLSWAEGGALTNPDCSKIGGKKICIFACTHGSQWSHQDCQWTEWRSMVRQFLTECPRPFRTTMGVSKVFNVQNSGAEPFGIVEAGPDKRMWFTEYATGDVGAMTSKGTESDYTLGFSPSDSIEITVGSG